MCKCKAPDWTDKPPSLTWDDTAGKIKVQECDAAELEKLYTDSAAGGVGESSDATDKAPDKEQMDKFIKYLDYIGKIEEKYKSSGVCTKKENFYFSDVGMGKPEDNCGKTIKDKVLKKEVSNYGIGFIIIAIVILASWIVHWPMYCLKGKGNLIPGTRI